MPISINQSNSTSSKTRVELNSHCSDLTTKFNTIKDERFQKFEQIGQGSFGRVFRGYLIFIANRRPHKLDPFRIDRETGEIIAIKIIDLEANLDREDINEVSREIALLANCSHPNIVRYRASFSVGSTLWTIMEYCALGSLRQLIDRGGPLSEDMVLIIAKDTISALVYLHDHGIAHRDIKAANILLNSDGKIKLGDLGVASYRPLWQGIESASSKHNPEAVSTLVGSPYWMAPELINNCSHQSRRFTTTQSINMTATDIWSLGITLYELLTGQPPLAHLDTRRAIALIATGAPPRLDPVRFGEGVRSLVEACLHDDPTKRPTAKQLQAMKCFQHLKKPQSHLLDLVALARKIIKPASHTQVIKGDEEQDSLQIVNKSHIPNNNDAVTAMTTMKSNWTFGTFRSADIRPLTMGVEEPRKEEKISDLDQNNTDYIPSKPNDQNSSVDQINEPTPVTPKSLRQRTFSTQSFGSDSTVLSGAKSSYLTKEGTPTIPTWMIDRPPSVLHYCLYGDDLDGKGEAPEDLVEALFAKHGLKSAKFKQQAITTAMEQPEITAIVHRLQQIGVTLPIIDNPLQDHLGLAKIIQQHREFLDRYQAELEEAEKLLSRLRQ